MDEKQRDCDGGPTARGESPVPVRLAMSTGWSAHRHPEAQDLLAEVAGFGLSRLEAGYSLQPEQLVALGDLLPGSGFSVDSVHNYCPTPPDHKCNWGDDYLLSSPDEECRRRGVAATLASVGWAERLGARIVVLHLGLVELDKRPYNRIKEAIAAGERGGEGHRAAVEELRRERARLVGPHLEAARRTLDDLLARLPPTLKLGIECRYEYFALPSLSEMMQLLGEYGDRIGYWHDMGHAHVQEYMGFYAPGEYIRTLHPWMLGVHMHDSLGISDHRAPGYGEIDFESSLKPYLRADVLRVLELHPRVTPEEAASGFAFLRARGLV